MRCPRLVLIGAAAGLTLWLVAGSAVAQTNCVPSTTPCQTCPPPPLCAPSATPCSTFGSSASNSTITTSSQTCAGATDQVTTILENTIGPANICIGANKSVGCLVPAGTVNLNVSALTISGASPVAVPTLSVWALSALAVALGALGLRRLSAS